MFYKFTEIETITLNNEVVATITMRGYYIFWIIRKVRTIQVIANKAMTVNIDKL